MAELEFVFSVKYNYILGSRFVFMCTRCTCQALHLNGLFNNVLTTGPGRVEFLLDFFRMLYGARQIISYNVIIRGNAMLYIAAAAAAAGNKQRYLLETRILLANNNVV